MDRKKKLGSTRRLSKKNASRKLTRNDIELFEMLEWEKMFLSKKGKKESLIGYV